MPAPCMRGASAPPSGLPAALGHDLCTTLNAILGHAQLLLLHEGLDGGAREQVEEIAKAGKELARLISDLFDQFPAAKPISPQREAHPAHPPAAPGQEKPRPRVLVAEDNPASQAVLRLQLGVLEADAVVVDDGNQALVEWQTGGYDLILSDRHMPGMDGLALAHTIRTVERETGGHVPIVAITAAHHADEFAACLQAGMDDVLPKPIELDMLRRMLERWLPQPQAAPLAKPPPPPMSRRSGDGAEPVLDRRCLSNALGDSDPALGRELVELFIATVREDLPACRRHSEQGDSQALALAMHKLKSPARTVGALRFARLAMCLETAAREGRMAEIPALLAELERSLIEVRNALDGQAPLTPD